ncbi:MAG: hypothetical protein H7246_04015, partial [Phycisphaerae bacterium]|nr:hypothetical protein [Saprospiraceae bacterium]
TVVLESDVITGQTCPNNFTVLRTYVATDECGNSTSCVQTILVSDLIPPTIVCPIDVTISCLDLVPVDASLSIVTTDNCGGVVTVVLQSDVITGQTCPNNYTILRTYVATDDCGNSTSCVQLINVLDDIAPTFINPPANLTIECFSVPPVAIPPTASDNCSGPVTVALLSEIQLPGVCPIVYILTRVWIATDACGNTATVSQTVSVQDTNAPQFINIPLNVVLECDRVTNLDDFQDWLDTQGGATASDCSTITWTYENSPFNLDTAGCAATFSRYIRFIATDACGNSAFRDARFIIIDSTPPSFLNPPQNFTVECIQGDQGEAQLSDWLENFGYSEVRDSCGEVSTEIALLSEILGCGNTYVRIYEFRATDECGNTNYVRATFAVVDTTPPVIVTCPQGNVLLTCEFDITAPDMPGVVAWDNCSAVTVTVQSEFRYGVGCRYWPLTTAYIYAVTDECGNVSTCYQTFQVVDSIPPSYTGPDTLIIRCIDDLPGTGDITDVLAPYLVDNCYETICIGEHVEGTDSNAVTFCVIFKDLCVNWADKVFVTFVAKGECKPLCSASQSVWGNPGGSINGMSTKEAIEQLINKYGAVTAGDLGKTISVSSATCLQSMLPGNGNTAQLGPGHHEFNTANGCHPASIMLNSDGSLKNKLAANVLALQLNIWYNMEFNERNLGVQRMSSLPLCLVDAIVLSKLEVDHLNVQGLLNLANDYLAGIGFFPPNFGTPLNRALENVNAYWLNCQLNDPCLNNVTLAGYLKTESQDGLEEGQVQLTSAGSALTKFASSDVDGFYEFSNAVPFAGNYTVMPTAEGMAPLNGVTTYDLVLISNHILDRKPLDSPYKMIAADANRSGNITTFDITELRKLILGVYDDLPNNTSWRFVDKSFVFPDLNNPFFTLFPERKTVESLQTSQMAEDFVSIKIGDVNGTAVANSLMGVDERSAGTLLFDLDDRSVTSGETFQVKVTADQIVQGYQFTLNTDGLEVLEVSGKNMSRDNIAVFAADGLHTGQPGALTASWNSPEGITTEVAEFTLTIRATQSGRLSKMLSLSSRITKSEAYPNHKDGSNDPIALDIALRFHDESGTIISSTGFELYQNVPNPFVDKTTIGFYLPEATEAILTMYDESGRLVYSQKGDFAKGYNVFAIEHPLTRTNGTLLYKVETATDRAIKKMIQTK